MNFSSLFGSLLQSILLKPVQKAGLWAARQSLGKDKGDAAKPIVDALSSATVVSLANVASAHLTNDKLAKQIGIPTTEEGLVSAAQSVIGGTSTLDLSHQNLLTDLLQQSIVKATAPASEH